MSRNKRFPGPGHENKSARVENEKTRDKERVLLCQAEKGDKEGNRGGIVRIGAEKRKVKIVGNLYRSQRRHKNGQESKRNFGGRRRRKKVQHPGKNELKTKIVHGGHQVWPQGKGHT